MSKNLNSIPFLTETEYQEYLTELPKNLGYVLSFPDKTVQQRLAPNVVEKTIKNLEYGNGTDIICLGGGSAERELMFFLNDEYGKKQQIKIFIYDLREDEPIELEKYRKEFPNIPISFITNIKIEDFNYPIFHINNTRLITCFGVLEYIEPFDACNLLKKIKDELKPFAIAFRFVTGTYEIAPEVNENTIKELNEIQLLLNKQYTPKIIDFETFEKYGLFTTNWKIEKYNQRNLSSEYSGTRIFPISLINYYSDKYELTAFDIYKVRETEYPSDIVIFFERKFDTDCQSRL